MKRLLLLLLCAAAMVACPVRSAFASADSGDQWVTVHAFSFGKADAYLIWNSAGAVLIDTGNSGDGKEIIAYMKEQEIPGLDVLILTHFDRDHIGGAAKVLRDVPVAAVMQSSYPKATDEYEKYCKALALKGLDAVTVREDTSFLMGNAVFEVYAPKRETYEEDPSNNTSLIISLKAGEVRFLFTGDSEEERLIEFLETDPGHCDVLTIPHHGRWIPHLDMLLKETTPGYAVITSSEEEPEDYMTSYHLKKAGINVLLTKEGAFDLMTDGRTLTLS